MTRCNVCSTIRGLALIGLFVLIAAPIGIPGRSLAAPVAEVDGGTGVAEVEDEDGVAFFGLGGEGRRVVFVIEGDGSIISDFVAMVTAMEESLAGLTDKHRYGVVVFDGEGAKEGKRPTPVSVPRPTSSPASPRPRRWRHEPNPFSDPTRSAHRTHAPPAAA